MNERILNGVGVFTYEGRVYLYFKSSDDSTSFDMAVSEDGFFFERILKDLFIETSDKGMVSLAHGTRFRITRALDRQGGFWLFLEHNKSLFEKSVFARNRPVSAENRSASAQRITADTSSDALRFSDSKPDAFESKETSQTGSHIGYANSSNLIHWKYKSTLAKMKKIGVVVPDYRYDGKYVMYHGDKSVHIYYSKDGLEWGEVHGSVLESRGDCFDKGPLSVENVFFTEKGILVLYHSSVVVGKVTHYSVGAALFDKEKPDRLLWRSHEPIWESVKEWGDKKLVQPVGVVHFRDRFISYWSIDGEGIFAVVYSFYKFHIPNKTKHVSLSLKRFLNNPILAPKPHNTWESFTTFNAATVYTGGKVHILYRAQGFDYVSVLGYASSQDGVTIDERLEKPVFLPHHIFDIPQGDHYAGPNRLPYDSGGGWGGCEDPRVTEIDGRLYMIYVANDGVSHPRLALTSIRVEDFLNKRWFWEKPVLISPPGVVDKSGCILPEKINGKYVIFHRIFPDILIDYVDDLKFNGGDWLPGKHRISVRRDKWDSRKIGAGAPPIKTKDGWLLIYYAVDDGDASRYKIGAMLLDLHDPTKVLHRTNAPILEPVEYYENNGFKPGIAYPCGAVLIKDTLFVYYGGADSVVCVATANIDHFLAELKYSEIAKMEPAIIRQVV